MASFQSLRLLVATRRHPSAWLLMVQLAGVLPYPAIGLAIQRRGPAPAGGGR